jgi:hypothetical protein
MVLSIFPPQKGPCITALIPCVKADVKITPTASIGNIYFNYYILIKETAFKSS